MKCQTSRTTPSTVAELSAHPATYAASSRPGLPIWSAGLVWICCQWFAIAASNEAFLKRQRRGKAKGSAGNRIPHSPMSFPPLLVLHRHRDHKHLAACRSRETSLYVPPRRPNRPVGLRVNAAKNNAKVLILSEKCSLRLSVRTPPFHGGESGSIPLGSATSVQRKLLSALRNFMHTPPTCRPQWARPPEPFA